MCPSANEVHRSPPDLPAKQGSEGDRRLFRHPLGQRVLLSGARDPVRRVFLSRRTEVPPQCGSPAPSTLLFSCQITQMARTASWHLAAIARSVSNPCLLGPPSTTCRRRLLKSRSFGSSICSLSLNHVALFVTVVRHPHQTHACDSSSCSPGLSRAYARRRLHLNEPLLRLAPPSSICRCRWRPERFLYLFGGERLSFARSAHLRGGASPPRHAAGRVDRSSGARRSLGHLSHPCDHAAGLHIHGADGRVSVDGSRAPLRAYVRVGFSSGEFEWKTLHTSRP